MTINQQRPRSKKRSRFQAYLPYLEQKHPSQKAKSSACRDCHSDGSPQAEPYLPSSTYLELGEWFTEQKEDGRSLRSSSLRKKQGTCLTVSLTSTLADQTSPREQAHRAASLPTQHLLPQTDAPAPYLPTLAPTQRTALTRATIRISIQRTPPHATPTSP
ncbi:uncharacterized protein K452DRAFT_307592 [Aplosporella prunicola CBS 121167]|uniref:Uncharacterized protein n=1 Tax=Aplosporella prunicola CBS 121167 TaxID=1176127 RepID=A0A6A6BJB3_9PEZI|nr:uncharacterized protein K452DRAFT_307592 [Aplosporella prunicola CBS 121167]KAF2143473.1 hypothetical protein K452DRAFT_307592 [Aplosporella prunicola CBS 121167]